MTALLALLEGLGGKNNKNKYVYVNEMSLEVKRSNLLFKKRGEWNSRRLIYREPLK